MCSKAFGILIQQIDKAFLNVMWMKVMIREEKRKDSVSIYEHGKDRCTHLRSQFIKRSTCINGVCVHVCVCNEADLSLNAKPPAHFRSHTECSAVLVLIMNRFYIIKASWLLMLKRGPSTVMQSTGSSKLGTKPIVAFTGNRHLFF